MAVTPRRPRLASSAVALAAQTDLLSQHADALLDLAHVLAASGRFPEAQVAASQALDLYQRKGNLPGTRESLGYLTRYAHTLRKDLLMPPIQPNSQVPKVELNQTARSTSRLASPVSTPERRSRYPARRPRTMGPSPRSIASRQMPQSGIVNLPNLPVVPNRSFDRRLPHHGGCAGDRKSGSARCREEVRVPGPSKVTWMLQFSAGGVDSQQRQLGGGLGRAAHSGRRRSSAARRQAATC